MEEKDVTIGEAVALAEMRADISFIKETLKDLRNNFVTKAEFEKFKAEHTTIKSIVYGAVGLILVSVIGALITMILKEK